MSRQLTSYEKFQMAVAKSANEADIERPFVPSGYCPRHYVQISNGMFDGLCPECEAAQDAE